MLNNQKLTAEYSTWSEQEKIHFLRGFDQQLDITLAAFFLTIVTFTLYLVFIFSHYIYW